MYLKSPAFTICPIEALFMHFTTPSCDGSLNSHFITLSYYTLPIYATGGHFLNFLELPKEMHHWSWLLPFFSIMHLIFLLTQMPSELFLNIWVPTNSTNIATEMLNNRMLFDYKACLENCAPTGDEMWKHIKRDIIRRGLFKTYCFVRSIYFL